jgi:hypothetical protein
MRLVKEIPHARYLIQVHEYNSKYLLKITLDSYEQLFKFEKDELLSLDELDGLLTPDFLSNCLARFMSMREDMLKFKKIAK